MKKVLFFVTFIVLFNAAYAAKGVMCEVRNIHSSILPLVKQLKLTGPFLDIYWDGGMTYNCPSTSGSTTTMSLTKTDSFGNSMTVNWSVTGNTLSWSVNVVPGAGINVGLHRFWIYDYNSEFFDTYADSDYEDPDGVGYGNTTWCASGTINLSTVPSPLRFSFEYFSSDTVTNAYESTTSTGDFVF